MARRQQRYAHFDRRPARASATTAEGTEISQIDELGTPTPESGRQTRFTPERIQQIKNLVERGTRREEIAELIGATVGSLQVTCSRLGISLRRPTFNNGLVSLRRNEPRLEQVPTPRSGHGSDMHLIKGRPERNSQPQPMTKLNTLCRRIKLRSGRMRRARRASPLRCSIGERNERPNCRSHRT